MAKRAPILDESFNPVAARFARYKRATQDPAREEPESEAYEASAGAEAPAPEVREGRAAEEKIARRSIAPHHELPKAKPPAPLVRAAAPEPPPEPEPEFAPVEAMTSSLRARVTETEREHYTSLALWLTGKQNQFSSVTRALLILLEHAQSELENRLPEVHRLERPSPKDRLAMALYEYRLAEIFWDCIDAAGKPPRQG